jgi:glutamine synthetase
MTLMFYGSNAKRAVNGRVPSWLDKFSCGVEDRSASVRIPACVQVSGKGYYEDRRPASNMDPYLATMALVCATLNVVWPLAVSSTPFL